MSRFSSILIKAALFLSINAALLFPAVDPYLDLIDPLLPFCDIPRIFDSSHQTFVEINNKLPGKNSYNALVQDYQRQRWQKLVSKIDKFKVEFASSPLQEAVEFLSFQAEVERLNPEATEALLHSERHFRELLLLYPRSSLIPAVQLSFANFYIRNENFTKGLGLARQLRRNFPFHSDHCYFMFSEAEAQYQLKNLGDAKRTYQAILQKCPSKKLRVGSQIRLFDINRKEKSKDASFDDYETLRKSESAMVQRFFPEIILNLGENAFRKKQYDKSLFFLNEFKRSTTNRHPCDLSLKKRLADVAMRKEKDLSRIVGKYLEVYELDPKSDLGKFSRVVALFFPSVTLEDGEFQRRENTVREIIPQISDKSLNLRAQVIESVANLKRPNQQSLEASKTLLLLKNSNPHLFKGKLDDAIKSDLLVFQRRKSQIYSHLSRTAWEKWYWETTLQAYEDWFKSSSQESQFKTLISTQMLELAFEKVKKGELESLVKNLSFWTETPYFEKPRDKTGQWNELVGTILVDWIQQPLIKQKKITQLMTQSEAYLRKVFGFDGQVLWVKCSIEDNKTDALTTLLAPWKSSRKIASQANSKNNKLSSASNLVVGQGFRKIKEFSLSDKYLSLVKAPEFSDLSVLEQIKNANDEKNFKGAILLGISGLKASLTEHKKTYIELLDQSVKSGKQWQFADSIQRLQKDIKLESSEKALLLKVVGRSKFEQSKFKEANDALAESLALDSRGKHGDETSFYLARSFAKLGNLKQAKETLTKLASKNDEFWSPLAETEIKLLETNEQN